MITEIELRGPLGKAGFQKLLRFLKKEAKFIKRSKRKTFVFHTNDKTLDLKVRTTDGNSEIVVKKGFWGAKKREEIILPIKISQVDKAKKLLAALGYKTGIVPLRETFVFEYKDIEFSLVKCPKSYYFYEAEFIGSKSIKEPEAYVQKILESLGLKIWSEREVYDFLMFCNKEIDEHFEVS
jgi:adenylate cyclase class IV